MPLDAISATLLTTAALMFVALIRRVRQGLWPRAARELKRRWLGADLPGGNPLGARLAPAQRHAWNLARRAAPHARMRCRVPLHRLLAPPPPLRSLSADLVVCDPSSNKRLVVLIQAAEPNQRRAKRLEQTRELLFTSGLSVSVWQQGAWPTVAAVREQLKAAGITTPSVTEPRRRAGARGFDVQTQPSTLV